MFFWYPAFSGTSKSKFWSSLCLPFSLTRLVKCFRAMLRLEATLRGIWVAQVVVDKIYISLRSNWWLLHPTISIISPQITSAHNNCAKCGWQLAVDKINSLASPVSETAGEAALLGDTPVRDDPAVDVVIKVENDVMIWGSLSTKICLNHCPYKEVWSFSSRFDTVHSCLVSRLSYRSHLENSDGESEHVWTFWAPGYVGSSSCPAWPLEEALRGVVPNKVELEILKIHPDPRGFSSVFHIITS